MKKLITTLLVLLFTIHTPSVMSEEHSLDNSFSADHHHQHGNPSANYIPTKILNPDDSEYEAPDDTSDYQGMYSAQVRVDELAADLHLILNIGKDGILNLAYYYNNDPSQTGVRFYVSEEEGIKKIDAFYQDLIILTAGLREGEGGLTAGLIGETISPIILLNQEGKVEEIYTYMNMAYSLRENYVNARVYQNIGLYLADNQLVIDVNHLIGLDSDQEIVAQFERVNNDHEDQLLVEQTTYELLQHNFDNHLIDYNDFLFDFNSVNDFLQIILAMNLKTNASFPSVTQLELLSQDQLEWQGDQDIIYGLLIDDSSIYIYDGESLYFSSDIKEQAGVYSSDLWVSD